MKSEINKNLIIALSFNYKQKLIQLITGYTQSTISKVISSETPYTPSLDGMTNEQAAIKRVIDAILQLRELPTSGITLDDKMYINLLIYCLVTREEIKELYYDISPYRIASVLRYNKMPFDKFNYSLIGIEKADWELFIQRVNSLRKD